ncbi:pilus assembly protein [Salmonella enterica]|nr:pilus assembly protein [Salmonella enterica]
MEARQGGDSPAGSVHDSPVTARGCARVCSETQRPGRSSRMKNGRKNQNSHHSEPGIRHSSPGQQKK